jgi:hypothetical protein
VGLFLILQDLASHRHHAHVRVLEPLLAVVAVGDFVGGPQFGELCTDG